MREEAPWAAPILDRMIGEVRATQAKLAELEDAQVETEEAAIASLTRQSSNALEGNAALVLWKSQRPDLYDEAVAQDKLIRLSPKLAARFVDEETGNVDFVKRFDHVVRIVKAAHDGEDIPLPQPVASSEGKTKEATAAKVAVDPTKVKAAAQAKLKEAAEAPGAVTLSDLSGGAPAAQSEEEQVEGESVQALGARLYKMTPDQLQAFLARNG